MSAELDDQSIKDEELLARFILKKCWIRSGDNSVKQDAFIPYPYPDLSVTRHIGLSKEDIWRIGKDVAEVLVRKRPDATLLGRADFSAGEARNISLNVQAYPLKENINHAHITGWPLDKPAQKSKAQELAAVARFIPNPSLAIPQIEKN
jgi:hypothetical protein